eukprot:TRINITY_DN26681_c0_g1_i1.p1 TRINITY_DN26681_c0_g1~~TRINITY_DN26681_c0_g1_i1.p1  ORF type:complete len:433 (-),score=51.75 TRINITY_DN26681_c0_g1_i1:224-1480(-)
MAYAPSPFPPALADEFQTYTIHQREFLNMIGHEHAQLVSRVAALREENALLKKTNQELKAKKQQAWQQATTRLNFRPNSQCKHVYDAPIHSVAFDGSDEIIAAACWDGKVILYNWKDGSHKILSNTPESGGLDQPMGGLYCVAFGKNQRLRETGKLGVASSDCHIYLWNYKTGEFDEKLKHPDKGHTMEVNCIDFHNAQNVLASASDDTTALIWDIGNKNTVLRTLKHDSGKEVYALSFLGEQNQYNVATCCYDYVTRVWDMRVEKMVQSLSDHTNIIIGVDFLHTGDVLATSSDDGTIAFYDTRVWRLLHRTNTRQFLADVDVANKGNLGARPAEAVESEVKRVHFSKDGRYLAAACNTGHVLVYPGPFNMNTLAPPEIVGQHEDCAFDVTWGTSPLGNNILASGAHDKTIKLWEQH